MNSNLIARTSISVSASRDRVWDALVDPEAIRHYMFGARVETDWQERSPITWSGEFQGEAYRDRGVILKSEPGRLLQFSHFSPRSGLPDRPENHHTVTIELSDWGNQTQVVLSQDNNVDAMAREHSEQNWEAVLVGLKKFLEPRRAAAGS